MAFSFRALTNTGNDNTFPGTVTKPTGVVDGDLLIVVAELEDASQTWSSVGSGFNAVTAVNSSASKLQIWWKVASSEPASWTWTASGGAIWKTITCLAYSGGTSPSVDVTGTGNSGTSQVVANQTAPSVTTTTNNALLIFAYCNDTSTIATSTTGAANNLRSAFGNVSIGDATITSPGATGSSAVVGTGTQTFAAMQIAFATGDPSYTLEQEGFRFRYDDGDETTATWAASQDTGATIAPLDVCRLRMLVNATLDPVSLGYQLEYSVHGADSWHKLLASQPVTPAPTFQAAGTAQNGVGNVTVAWPTHEVDDIALLFIESCGGEAANLGTANGFVAVTNSPSNTGTTTNGTRLSVYWCRATSTSMASPVVTDPGDHVYAQILTFRGCIKTGDPWDVTAATQKASASTSLTYPTVTTTIDNCLIVLGASRDNDSAAAALGTVTNSNLTGIAERADAGTTSGNGGGLMIATGVMATAGATGTSTATITSSINAYLTIALKPEPAFTELFLLSASSNIAASAATSTTAQLTAPSSKSPADFSAMKISDDTNPITADLGSGKYGEAEWCFYPIASITLQDYDFRVTVSGAALDTYGVTPVLTISSGGGAQTLTLSTITMRQRVYTQQLNQNVLPVTVQPLSIVGSQRLNENLSLSPIPTRQQVNSETLNLNIAPAPIPARQQVFNQSVVPAAVTVTVSAIPTRQQVYNDTLKLNVVLSAIAAYQRVGLQTLNLNINPLALTIRQQVFSEQLNLNTILSSLPNRQQVFSQTVSVNNGITLTAIPVRQLVNALQLNENVSLSAIPFRQAVQSSQLNLNILPAAIPMRQMFGANSLVAGGVTISLSAIPTLQNVRLHSLVPAAVTVTLTTVPNRQRVGLQQLNENLSLSAMPMRQKIGLDILNLTIAPSTIPMRQNVGLQQLLALQVLTLAGLPYRAQVGLQRLNLNLSVAGLPFRQRVGLVTLTLADGSISFQSVFGVRRVGLISIASAIGAGVDTLIITELAPAAMLRITMIENSAVLIINEIEDEAKLQITSSGGHSSAWYSYSDRYGDDY